RGRWALIQMRGKAEAQPPWLLIKEKDALARPASEFSVVDEMPDSVAGLGAGKTGDANAGAAVIANAGAGAGTRQSGPRRAPLAEAPAAALPTSLSPQLATLAKGWPADDANWLHEIKFDGYRLLAR